MNLLITGGAGFIGCNFIYYMQQKHPDYRLICMDNLTYSSNIDALKQAQSHSGFRFIKCDIADADAVCSVFEHENFDIVVNFAAESHVDRSIANPGIFFHSNVMGTQVLLDACRKYGVKRFHQISTDEVYGDLPLDRPNLFFTEDTLLNPSSPYSASKASADLLALAYFRTFNLPVTVSRCSNNYGPHQFPEKLIPRMIFLALHDKKLPVYGTGDNIRDWLHVADHCVAIDLILHSGRPGEVYNIGAGNEVSNITLVKNILQLLNKPEALIDFVPDRPGHDKRYAVNCAKIQNNLGWMPATAFKGGLESTVNWYLADKKRWDKYFEG